MKVIWTPRALARLRQIHAYIAKEHPPNANQMVDRLTKRVAQLSDHPLSGRVVEFFQRDDLRELIESRYRIVYLVLPDRVDIITVRDTSRRLPRRLSSM